jgi:hypothetical protein
MDSERWVPAIRYEEPFEMVTRIPAEAFTLKSDGKVIEPGDPACYVVVNAKNLGEEGGRFDTPEKAIEAANEMNRAAVQGPLDPEFAARRNRLKELAPRFGPLFYDGPPEARWPVRPGKYLLHDYGVGWHADVSWELADDLETVRAAFSEPEANIGRIIDLDTGEEVDFKREVVVTFKT